MERERERERGRKESLDTVTAEHHKSTIKYRSVGY